MIRDPDRDLPQTELDPGGPRSSPTTLHLRHRNFCIILCILYFLCLARCHRDTRTGGLLPRPAPLSTPRPPCRPPAPHAAAQCSPASFKGTVSWEWKESFPIFHGCGSAFILSGSSILGWIPIRIQYGSGSRVLMTKIEKNYSWKKLNFFLIKNFNLSIPRPP